MSHVDGLFSAPLALALGDDGVNKQTYSPEIAPGVGWLQNTAYDSACNHHLRGHGGNDVINGAPVALWKEAA